MIPVFLRDLWHEFLFGHWGMLLIFSAIFYSIMTWLAW